MNDSFKSMTTGLAFVFLLFMSLNFTCAQDIMLPPPQKTGGMPLMEALNNRKSNRNLSGKELPSQVLSDLLWAAYGYNRPEEMKRTAPSAMNVQNISVYVALADGFYLYDAKNNLLKLITKKDARGETGQQNFVRDVPLNLVYIADLTSMKNMGNKALLYSYAHTGFISQNVYLFCASSGLGTVVRDMVDRDVLRKTMNLSDKQYIILCQSIGYPR